MLESFGLSIVQPYFIMLGRGGRVMYVSSLLKLGHSKKALSNPCMLSLMLIHTSE